MVSQSRTFTGTLWASPAPGPTARRAFKVYIRNVRDFRIGSTCWMTKTQVKSRDSHEETTARAHPSTKQFLTLFTCLPSLDANAHVVNGRTRGRAPNPLMPEGSLCKPGLPTQREGEGLGPPLCATERSHRHVCRVATALGDKAVSLVKWQERYSGTAQI